MASDEVKKGLAILVGGILLGVGMILLLLGFKFNFGPFALPSVIPALVGYWFLR